MIFKLHYWFVAAGANAMGILLGVYIQEYTDANAIEIGALYMLMPFMGLIFRPIICAKADREQAHQWYLLVCLFIVAFTYAPFVIIPILGPSVYKVHPRTCWYILVVLKVIGDIAFGGVFSIGDSLAVNYAKRIGTPFTVYRVWGTISWLVFGIVIGQVNEVSFMPKYVPGFIILIMSTLLDAFVIWLWPKEYFLMVPERVNTDQPDKGSAGGNSFTKSLMPRNVVLAHMKMKLLSLFTCGSLGSDSMAATNSQKSALPPMITLNGSTLGDKDNMSPIEAKLSGGLRINVDEKKDDSLVDGTRKGGASINKMTQLRILVLLFKRDPRLILYILYLIAGGTTMAPTGFLFMSLSERCHGEGSCDFSMLGGLLQVSMAVNETFIFIIIKSLQEKIGRLNTGALAFLLYSCKMIFYGSIWPDVDPHWSLLVEGLRGASYGIYLTLMVELGYKFANEVKYIIPELLRGGLIPKDCDCETLELSLSSTMQSVLGGALDGLGRGLGAMIFGIILHHYPYMVLWRVIASMSLIFLTMTLGANLLDHIFHFNLGLDSAARQKELEAEEAGGDSKQTPNAMVMTQTNDPIA